MGKAGKFKNSWLLFKSSLAVVRDNKKLLVFPVVIAVLTIFIALFFLAPIALQPTGYSYGQIEHWETIGRGIFAEQPDGNVSHPSQGERKFVLTHRGVVYFVIFYFISVFLATFFNVAFYNEILRAFSGQPVSIRGGIRVACTKLRAILLWSLLAGLVGLIIKKVEERFGFIGRIVIGLIGLAWNVAAIFVIPVIIREEDGSNPILMLKKSAEVLKKTWGESLIGYAGLQFGNLLIFLISLVVLVCAIVVSIILNNFWIFGIILLIYLMCLFAFAYLTYVASQIYRCALYIFAKDGVVPGLYSRELLDMAWKIKKN